MEEPDDIIWIHKVVKIADQSIKVEQLSALKPQSSQSSHLYMGVSSGGSQTISGSASDVEKSLNKEGSIGLQRVETVSNQIENNLCSLHHWPQQKRISSDCNPLGPLKNPGEEEGLALLLNWNMGQSTDPMYCFAFLIHGGLNSSCLYSSFGNPNIMSHSS